MSWMNYFSTAKANHLKRVIFELIQERYSANEQIVERIGASLLTDKDNTDFLQLITDVYESAYLRAVKDHRDQLQKLGLIANIKPSDD